MPVERLNATDPNGQACIVVRTTRTMGASHLVGGHQKLAALARYSLASTGETLSPTDDPKILRSGDRKRNYTLV